MACLYSIWGGWVGGLKQNFRPTSHPHIDYNWNQTIYCLIFFGMVHPVLYTWYVYIQFKRKSLFYNGSLLCK